MHCSEDHAPGRKPRARALLVVRKMLAATALVGIIAGCGSSHRAHASAHSSPSAQPAGSSQTASCARTFQDIIRNANPGADPAWVNYFLPQNQARGLPVAIGEYGAITPAAIGSNVTCTLTYKDPAEGILAEVVFVVGHTSFDDPDGEAPQAMPVPAGLTAPTPNIELGPYGEMTSMSTGALLASAQPPPATQSTSASSTTSASTAPLATTTTTGAPPVGPVCGTVQGGPDDYQGQMLTVHTTSGVPCATALIVFRDLGTSKAQNHQGSDAADSYLTVDGWKCPYGNMGTQICEKGSLSILARASQS